MKGHIFDIDVLIDIESKPWIVNKNFPNEPLLKISKSDFNLFKNGVYKNQGNKIEYNDKVYWLPNEVYNRLKVIAKNRKFGMDDYAVSLQEFINKDIIDEIDFKINYEVISGLKNKNEDIYLICSVNSKRNYEKIIEKLIEKLNYEGIAIKDFYYINETFYNINSDEIIFKKGLICLQHLIGYKIKGNKFVDEEISKYSELNFYDNDFDTLKITDEINSYLKTILNKTDLGLKNVIKEQVQDYKSVLIANKITNNKYNNFITSEVQISLSNIVKFENFKWNKH